jgi:hypothetical protein
MLFTSIAREVRYSFSVMMVNRMSQLPFRVSNNATIHESGMVSTHIIAIRNDSSHFFRAQWSHAQVTHQPGVGLSPMGRGPRVYYPLRKFCAPQTIWLPSVLHSIGWCGMISHAAR